MRIGLIDVDSSKKFPNLALMKISSFHKQHGGSVEFYQPLFGGRYDIVYVSKIFTYTTDYPYPINAEKIIFGGTGYDLENKLPIEIEGIYPDYSLYGIENEAYGFLSRGCPRQCKFCNVGEQQGIVARKVADLSSFWDGQKSIKLLDPNILAVPQWKELFKQLEASGAWVDFTQGLDIRLMTKDKAEALGRLKIKMVHFAWDDMSEKTLEKLKEFKEWTNLPERKLRVYVLTNYNTTLEEDLYRIYTLRELGYDPYVMIYEKEKLKRGSKIKKMQRWVNNKWLWRSNETLEDFITAG